MIKNQKHIKIHTVLCHKYFYFFFIFLLFNRLPQTLFGSFEDCYKCVRTYIALAVLNHTGNTQPHERCKWRFKGSRRVAGFAWTVRTLRREGSCPYTIARVHLVIQNQSQDKMNMAAYNPCETTHTTHKYTQPHLLFF